MGGGILQLISFGAQSIPLMGNPEFSYFKHVFKRHTNFATEVIKVPFDSHGTILNYDQGLTVQVKIPRNADLVKDIFLSFKLPDIYSDDITRFRWISNIGQYIINNYTFTVGGQVINKLYGEWLDIWSELTIPADKRDLFNRMTGNVETFTAPKMVSDILIVKNNDISNVYYPSASSGNPSIKGRRFYIPLNLWFSKHPGLALPLVALAYHDCELTIQFNPLKDLYQLWNADLELFLSPSNYDATPNSQLPLIGVKPVSYGFIGRYLSWDSLVHTSPILQPLAYDQSDNTMLPPDKIVANQQYQASVLQSLTSSTPGVDINGCLEIDYVYLDDDERKTIAEKGGNFLIEYIYHQQVTGLTPGTNVIDIYLANPIKEICWTTRRSDTSMNNEPVNLTNVTPADSRYPILASAKILFNGQDRIEEKEYTYFNLLEPYMHHTCGGREGIYSYSFSLNPEKIQPSGSVNTSRINKFQLYVTLNTYDTTRDKDYTYTLNVFSISQNMFRVLSGLGGLVYAI